MREPQEPFVLRGEIQALANRHYRDLEYHHGAHAKNVYNRATDLLKASRVQLSPDEKKALMHACFYHDAGFHEDAQSKGFGSKEEYSAHLAAGDLKKLGFSSKHVALVKKLILATHRDAKPRSFLEQLVRASDLQGLVAHASLFVRDNTRLRKERERLEGRKLSDKAWLERTTRELSHYAEHEGKWMAQFHENFPERVLANARALKQHYGRRE